MKQTTLFTIITHAVLGLLFTVSSIGITAVPQAGASERSGRNISEIVRRWTVEKKEIPRGRVMVTVSDMKGWKGFHSICFVLALKKDLDSIEGVNANKHQPYEHVGGKSDILGIRQENKALYSHELENYGLFFGVVMTY